LINENIETISNQISQTEMNIVQMKNEIVANSTNRLKAVEKDILAVMENEIKHMKERLDRETSNLNRSKI